MLREEDVPASDRQLLIEGRVSAKSLAAVRAGLPLAWPSTARCFFASYAYADLPLGKCFDAIFPREHPENAEPTVATIVGVTQQFGKPFDEVPHGWKTICLLDFPEGEPAVMAHLPTVDTWGESKARVSLCTRETLDSIGGFDDAMTSEEHGQTEGTEEVGHATLAPTRGPSSDPLPLHGRIEHFTLLEQIDLGGMGELYLAHDERLGRKVAALHSIEQARAGLVQSSHSTNSSGR